MDKWAYHVTTIDVGGAKELLTEWGADGWELVSLTPVSDNHGRLAVQVSIGGDFREWTSTYLAVLKKRLDG